MEEIIREQQVDVVVFSYSDITHADTDASGIANGRSRG